MSEIVERVAKAIDAAMAKAPPGEIGVIVARAAIDAMREPTNDMHKAMCDAYSSPIAIWMAGIDEALK